MFTKLLTTSDGKIPFLQIIVGVLLGAIGMFIYAKFWKPKMLFDDNSTSLMPTTSPQPIQSLQPTKTNTVVNRPSPQQDSQPAPRMTANDNGKVREHMTPQAYVEIQQMPMPPMPPIPTLATIYETEECSQDPDEEDETEDMEDQRYAPMHQ